MQIEHLADQGIYEDKSVVFNDAGFLIDPQIHRWMFGHFIKNGERVYDVLERYICIKSFILFIQGGSNARGNVDFLEDLMVPFLVASDVTDSQLSDFYQNNISYYLDSKKTVRYAIENMRTFLCTNSYPSAVTAIEQKMNIPFETITFKKLYLRNVLMTPNEKSQIIELTSRLGNIPVSNYPIIHTMLTRGLPDEDRLFIQKVDSLFETYFPQRVMEYVRGQGVRREKADFYKRDYQFHMSVPISDYLVIGTNDTDFELLHFHKISGGACIAFNPTESAIFPSHIAILSKETIILTLFMSEFIDKGLLGICKLADNWNRKYIKRMCADKNIVEYFLSHYPDELPYVRRITDENFGEIARDSYEFRKKIKVGYQKNSPKYDSDFIKKAIY